MRMTVCSQKTVVFILSSYFDQFTEPLFLQGFTILFVVSFVLCLVIVISSGFGLNRRAALDETAIQSAHSGFVPRFGGLAIFISILGFMPLLSFGFIPLSVVFDLNIDYVKWLAVSALPIFVVGLAEDLGYNMTPKMRLFASALSSLLATFFFKIWLTRLGIPGVDHILVFALPGILFTIFATVGVVNAFNLIDGLNGLSSFVSISISIALAIIALHVDNTSMAFFLMLLPASVLGFLLLNFPFGKIFLGDSGAYVLGHFLVWCAILLVNYEVEISPFAILLIFFWPVADTGLAIWRRWKLGNPTDRPDRLHFHQLAMRYLEIRFFGRHKRHLVNPISTVFLVPLISVPQILGVLFWNNFKITVWGTLCMGLFFMLAYLVGINSAKKSRPFN